MRIGEIMTRDPLTVAPDMEVGEVAKLLVEHRLNSVPVLDADGVLVGIVATGDLTHRLADRHSPERQSLWRESFYSSPLRGGTQETDRAEGRIVEQVMTRKVVSVNPDDDMAVAARMLLEHRVHALPVLEDGQLAGIVSRHDLLRCLTAHPECCNPMRRS